MSNDYELRLDTEYALSLFQAEVDKNTAGTQLECWGDVIMDWYEDQLEYGEIDWAISIPDEVRNDIVDHRMIVITHNDPHFSEIDRIYEEEGTGQVDDEDCYVARILFQDKDNDGNTVYLCQREL